MNEAIVLAALKRAGHIPLPPVVTPAANATPVRSTTVARPAASLAPSVGSATSPTRTNRASSNVDQFAFMSVAARFPTANKTLVADMLRE
jgi:hypothetical protein